MELVEQREGGWRSQVRLLRAINAPRAQTASERWHLLLEVSLKEYHRRKSRDLRQLEI